MDANRIPGMYLDIDNNDYHDDTVWKSSSQFKKARESAHHYNYFIKQRRGKHAPTTAKVFGSLVHKLVLEPSLFDAEYFVMDEKPDMRTKVGKALMADMQRLHMGKTLVEKADYLEAKACASSILVHPDAHALLTRTGIAEASIYVLLDHVMPDGEVVQFKVRIRPDWLIAGTAIVDLKTSKDPSITGFCKDAFGRYGYDYDLSAALYVRAWEAYSGECLPFYWIVVNNDEPYETAVYKMSLETYERGCTKLSEALTTIVLHERKGTWEFQAKMEEV